MNYILSNGKKIDLASQNKIAPVKVYTYHSPAITKTIEKDYNQNVTIFTVYNVFEADSINVIFNNNNYAIKIVN